MFKAIAATAAILVAAIASAQPTSSKQILAYKYDLDSTSYIYCKMSEPITGYGRIETSGSSATVTAVTGNTIAFAPIVEGDEIVVSHPSLTAPIIFTVVAKASDVSITADRAINIDLDGGVAFTWRDQTCGTAATDGWVSLPVGTSTVVITYRQGNLTGGLTFIVEGIDRLGYGVPAQLATGVLATASTTLNTNNTLIIGERMDYYRVGLKATTDDTGGDVTTNREQISVVISTVRE